MDAMSKFYILFCLLECVMVVVSVDTHSQIKGKFYIMRWVVLAWGIFTNNISDENIKFYLVDVFAVFKYWNSFTFHYIISVESISAFSQTWLQPIRWNSLVFVLLFMEFDYNFSTGQEIVGLKHKFWNYEFFLLIDWLNSVLRRIGNISAM